jgi:RNA polymerase sigma-70 factor (ECF subfamily)
MVNQQYAANPNAWVDEHGDVLYRYALNRLFNPVSAEDAVQETFLVAMKSNERFAGTSSERTWPVGILKHKIVDYIRKESREGPYDNITQTFGTRAGSLV